MISTIKLASHLQLIFSFRPGLEREVLNILLFKSRNIFNFYFFGYIFPDDLFLVAVLHALRKVFLNLSACSLYILP